MRVARLRLTDFRNYHTLDLALPPGLIVLRGQNAQGKSNLLEAIGLIATSRSFRTNVEREAVRWGAAGHFARIEATIERRTDEVRVELLLSDAGLVVPGGTEEAATTPPPPGALLRKRIRVNGVPRRAMDLLGLVPVVVFAPADLALVTGSPAERRRFLDLTLCQVHPHYCRALSQYQKVVTQRAALLRRIRDGEEDAHALTYWDEQLARLAAPVLRQRAAFVARASAVAARVYAALSASTPAEEAEEPPAPELRLVYRPSFTGDLGAEEAQVAAALRTQLGEVRRREIAQGANVLGPHRDDLAFFTGDVDLAVYGSRGQQRTVALALKLAELEYIEEQLGEEPILLLDDVLSELDAQRRDDLLRAVHTRDQVVLTVTDATALPPSARAAAHAYLVRRGEVVPDPLHNAGEGG